MSKEISFGDKKIGSTNPTYIVAEIGMNHNGSLELAKEMIRLAADAGTDAVKFQSFNTKKFLSANYFDFEERIKYELSLEDHKELKKEAEKFKVDFLSTPLDYESLDMLAELGVEAFKVASCDLNNLPFFLL